VCQSEGAPQGGPDGCAIGNKPGVNAHPMPRLSAVCKTVPHGPTYLTFGDIAGKLHMPNVLIRSPAQ
jgi:hypothetical protein